MTYFLTPKGFPTCCYALRHTSVTTAIYAVHLFQEKTSDLEHHFIHENLTTDVKDISIMLSLLSLNKESAA